MSKIIGNPVTFGTGGVDGLGNALIFSSTSDFTLEHYNHVKTWDGLLEWTDGAHKWAVWDGTTVLHSNSGFLALRGTGNTVITGDAGNRWILLGNKIHCDGNIETLLDYQMAAAGNHPTMAARCYVYMFYQSDLVTAPALPSTVALYSCYESMFNNCTSLITAPALPATQLGEFCYQNMFFGCTSLITAPALPATTLARACYATMFISCNNLRNIPVLAATALAKDCYRNMFGNCSKVKLSSSQTGNYTTPYRIPVTGSGTVGENSLMYMFSNTGGTFTGTPSINTTYYLDSTVNGVVA